jgi:PAS domain S-box-containing protein
MISFACCGIISGAGLNATPYPRDSRSSDFKLTDPRPVSTLTRRTRISLPETEGLVMAQKKTPKRSSKQSEPGSLSHDQTGSKTFFFDASIAANSISNFKGVITEANGTFLRLWNYPDKADVLGKPMNYFFTDPDEASAILSHLNTLDQWEGTYVAKRKDGSTFIAKGLASVLRNKNGKRIGCQFSVLDATESGRMEAELKCSEKSLELQNNLFSALLKNLPLGVLMVEVPSGKPLLANEAARKLLGQDVLPDAARKKTAEVYKTRKTDSREPYPLDKLPILSGMNGEMLHVGDMVVERPDGSEIYVEICGSPVTDDQGKVWANLVSFIDITERQRAAAAHKRLEDELRQAQKLEAVGQLAGGVAHDFNNLLMSIMGYADLCLQELPPDHPVREWLDEILNDAQRSAAITKKLLTFARKQPVFPKVLNLNETVESELKLLRRLISERIQLIWMPGANLWPVEIDPSQIDQILINLCVNARDAISDTGKVSIETDNTTLDALFCAEHEGVLPGEYVQMAVSDNGCGMEKEILAHIFEPFFTTKEASEGTGLGLATVYGIVRQNRGLITVLSDPGKGTTFKIYLPRIAEKKAKPAGAKKRKTSKSRGETILLVEDERTVRTVCGLNLKALGYHVLAAETPAEAIDMASRYTDRIHLVLTDVVMSGMDGWQLAGRLEASRPGIKVLLMSGYPTGAIKSHGAFDEKSFFIAKPFSRDELALKVREVLEKK